VTSIGAEAFSKWSGYWSLPITITAPHEASYYGYTPGEKETWQVAN